LQISSSFNGQHCWLKKRELLHHNPPHFSTTIESNEEFIDRTITDEINFYGKREGRDEGIDQQIAQ